MTEPWPINPSANAAAAGEPSDDATCANKCHPVNNAIEEKTKHGRAPNWSSARPLCTARYTPRVPTVVANERSSSFAHPVFPLNATPHALTLYKVPAHSCTAMPNPRDTQRWRSPSTRAGESRNHWNESRDAIIQRYEQFEPTSTVLSPPLAPLGLNKS